MSTTQPRVTGAGSANGQFATVALAATGTELHAPAPVDELLKLTERAFPPLEEAPYVEAISRVDAQQAARAILGALSDDEFFHRHWFGIESAAMQYQRFSCDQDGEEAAAASPADTLGVDLGEFMSVNEADRPGEADYVGYNFRGFAEEVTEEWRATLEQRVKAAVVANEAALVVGSRASTPAAA
jgi:hypothetical protein